VNTFAYDAAGQTSALVYGRGNRTSIGYDANGQRTRMELGTQRHTFGYDAVGAMTDH